MINLLDMWPIIGLIVLFSPLFYDRSKKQLLNISLALVLVVGAYFVFCRNSCLEFAAYILIVAGVGTYSLLKFGISDPRFTAKKFVYYRLLSLALFGCLSTCFVRSPSGLVLIFIIFEILLAGYPFHGWIEPFVMHAPSGLLSAYLVSVYPLDTFFMLKLFSIMLSPPNYNLFHRICVFLGVLGTLFVPVLFFTKSENRRFLSYLISWNTGIMFLFLSYCSMSNYGIIMQMAILQGFVLGVLGQIFVYLHRNLQHDNLVKLGEVRHLNKICYFFLKFFLCISWALPLLVAIFFIRISPAGWCMLLMSLGLYGIFLKNLFKNVPEENYLSFK